MDENYSKLVDIAYNMHISGKLDDAKSVYEKLLSLNSDDINVLNLYAQLNVSIKDYDRAIELFKTVYEKTKLDDVLLNMSKVYIAKNDYIRAIESLKNIKTESDNSFKILGFAYMKLKQYKKAADNYLKITKPEFLDYFNLSTAYLQLRDSVSSLKYALLAFEKNNKDIDLLNRIAVLFKDEGNDEKAVEFFNLVLEIEPKNRQALQNIANIYKNYDKKVTIQILNDLHAMYPKDSSILSSLYVIHTDMMNYSAAYNTALKLINLNPDNYENYTFAGDALFDQFNYDDALKMYKTALSKTNEDIEYVNLQIAYIYSISGKKDVAVSILKQYPESKIARTDYAYLLCKEKNFSEAKEGFFDLFSVIKSETEIEKGARSLFYKLNLDKKYSINELSLMQVKKDNTQILSLIEEYMKKVWKNNNIKGKRLLVYSGHGAGDLFMCCRYLNMLSESASEIIVQVPDSILDLFKFNFPNFKIVSINEKISDEMYDFSTSFMCILYNVNVDFNNLSGKPYLKIGQDKVNEKSKLKVMKTSKRKIGIFWQGNPAVYANRSVKLKFFEPLFCLSNTQIYSFQISKVDFESDELKQKLDMIDLAPFIKNYTDTAAFLKNIDTLITIDTSIAHLAGSLGVKTFLLLPYDSEWRWFNDTKTTPWYDSIKIFKQVTPSDWNEVIQRVKHELEL